MSVENEHHLTFDQTKKLYVQYMWLQLHTEHGNQSGKVHLRLTHIHIHHQICVSILQLQILQLQKVVVHMHPCILDRVCAFIHMYKGDLLIRSMDLWIAVTWALMAFIILLGITTSVLFIAVSIGEIFLLDNYRLNKYAWEIECDLKVRRNDPKVSGNIVELENCSSMLKMLTLLLDKSKQSLEVGEEP